MIAVIGMEYVYIKNMLQTITKLKKVGNITIVKYWRKTNLRIMLLYLQ